MKTYIRTIEYRGKTYTHIGGHVTFYHLSDISNYIYLYSTWWRLVK